MTKTLVYKETLSYANVHTMTYYDFTLEKSGKVKIMVDNRYYSTLNGVTSRKELKEFVQSAIAAIDPDVIYLGRNL